MSCPTTVQTILGTECIGNSLPKINDNFENLKDGICDLYTTYKNLTSFNTQDSNTIDLNWNSSTRTLSADLTTTYKDLTSFNTQDSNTIDLNWNSSTRTLSAQTAFVMSSGLKLDSSKLYVDLDPLGGLEFNSQKQIRITVNPATLSVNLAVRPSDLNSTDSSTIERKLSATDTTVLQPYFQTVTGAVRWATQNLNSNIALTIFVDEDAPEKLFSLTGSLTGQYYESPPLGLKPGFYVWHGNSGNFGAGGITATGNLIPEWLGTLTISGRYWSGVTAGSGSVVTRSFTTPPYKVSLNCFVCTNKTLTFGDFGGSANVWTDVYGPSESNTTNDYSRWVPLRGSIADYTSSGNQLTLKNLNFAADSNIDDIYFFISKNTPFNVRLDNITVTMEGNGVYAPILLSFGSGNNLTIVGSLLAAPDNSTKMPGYGLAFVGNSNPSTPTKLNNFGVFTEIAGSFADLGIANRTIGFFSELACSMIFDGHFQLVGSIFTLNTGSSMQRWNSPLFRTSSSSLAHGSFDWNSENFTLSSSTMPFFSIQKNTLLNFITRLPSTVRSWTFNNTEAYTELPYRLPIIINYGSSLSATDRYGLGTFNHSLSTYTISDVASKQLSLNTLNYDNTQRSSIDTFVYVPFSQLSLYNTTGFYTLTGVPGGTTPSTSYTLAFK